MQHEHVRHIMNANGDEHRQQGDGEVEVDGIQPNSAR